MALPDGSRGRAYVIGGAATLITLALIPVYRQQQLSWPEATAAAITFVLPCILLGWVVWRLLTRGPKAQGWTRAAAMHVLAAATFSVVWTLPLVVLVYVLRQEVNEAFLKGGAVWQLAWGVLIYCVLVVAARAHRRLRERELAAANAELQALRAQLDPHFLFNTLHSLTQLAREDPAATQDALQRFGELMRYVLSSGREAGADASLEQELEFVRNYLSLEQLRLGERLRVIEQVDADALELAAPPLLLQPLVENAIRHGLSPRREGGTVTVVARLADDRLLITVSDDGDGADPTALAQSRGLGLRAVERQLQAHFRGAAAFSVDTRPHAGFTVSLALPARLPGRSA